MVVVEYLPKGCWGTLSKAFHLIFDATGQAEVVYALDLRYPTSLMIGVVLGWH